MTIETIAEACKVVFPSQCSCGHLYIEQYQFKQPTEHGLAGFCWCGWCKTRLNVIAALGEK